ncbi:MAG: nucleoside kinase [OCS116 cluster bacterium]|nr:nucleoside kinase [OCS116 cluster bacterium]
MGIRNYLIEGGSCTGKTAVCDGLLRLGFHAIHGDRVLAYQGDPKTGATLDGFVHEHHIWDVDKVKSLVADRGNELSFFCGGSRNFHHFIDLFDVDIDTLNERLGARPEGEFGSELSERELIVRLHMTKSGIPENAVSADANVPLADVVDEILRQVNV